MIASLLVFVVFPSFEPHLREALSRDDYGVPHVTAASLERAFELAGRAVAQDRLWQMELSRRAARGRLAEVLGPSALPSDRETVLFGYTDEELRDQFEALPPAMKAAWEAYARGVNEEIEARRAEGRLPEGYARAGLDPEPWTVLDSAAISVNLARRFGSGGDGELRNYLLYLYLRNQPVRDRVLDLLDDLAWQNDPRSIPTIPPEDDPLAADPPRFPTFDRAVTERHLASLPPSNPLELLPAARRLAMLDSARIAERLGLPWKVGSYAIVVGKSRSATGFPLLLSAPQMGFSSPSVLHEMTIDAPGYRVAGVDVPGVPGIVIGFTPDLAWALTSGVADVQDVFFNPRVDDRSYRFGDEIRPLEVFERTIAVKDGAAERVLVKRTHFGPVVLESRAGNVYYSRCSTAWKKELAGFAVLFELARAEKASDLLPALRRVPLSFNVFFAFRSGEIGFHYAGAMPLRAAGIDPRFPTPGEPKFAWRGLLEGARQPYVVDPRSGLLANWNNKPATWWPNFDTPVWGRLFRNEMLLKALGHPGREKLSVADLERAAWEIARTDESTCGAFASLFARALEDRAGLTPLEREAADLLAAYDGWRLDGEQAPVLYDALVSQLRRDLYVPLTGNFVSDANLDIVIQPSVLLDALEGRTKVDVLAGRSAGDVIREAFRRSVERLSRERGPDPLQWRFEAPSIRAFGDPPVPYSARGTMIQIVELGPRVAGRNVVPPGVAEDGPHRLDQVPLSRQWTYKVLRAW